MRKKLELRDDVTAKGSLKIFVRRGGEGDFKLEREVNNIVVNLGRNLIRDNVFGSQSDYVQWGALSDDGTTPEASDTSLGGNEVRKSFTAGYPDNNVNYESTVEFYVDGTDWAAASPSAMTATQKAGLYYQSTGSYLYCAASFDSVSVDSDTEMVVQWKVVFSDA